MIRTWFFNFCLEEEADVSSASRVSAADSDPTVDSSEKPSGLVKNAPCAGRSRRWKGLDALDNWADAYVDEATVPLLPYQREDVDTGSEGASTTAATTSRWTRRAVDPNRLDVKGCPTHSEDLFERLPQIFPDDEGGWYRDFGECALVCQIVVGRILLSF